MGKLKIITQNVSIVISKIIKSVLNWASANESAMFRFIVLGIVMILDQNYVYNNLLLTSKEMEREPAF